MRPRHCDRGAFVPTVWVAAFLRLHKLHKSPVLEPWTDQRYRHPSKKALWDIFFETISFESFWHVHAFQPFASDAAGRRAGKHVVKKCSIARCR